MYRVVYIMGPGHSGSTLLAFLLNTHPDIVSVGELGRLITKKTDRRCSCGESLSKCYFWVQFFKTLETDSGVKYKSFNYENHFLKQLFNVKKSNVIVESLRQIILSQNPFYQRKLMAASRFYVEAVKTIQKISNTKILADTSKSITRFEILNNIPDLDLYLIWLVRDVRGYVNSAKRKDRNSEMAATKWAKTHRLIREIYNEFPLNKKYMLKYEDLCMNPNQKMNELFQFIRVADYKVPDDYKSMNHHIFGNRMKKSSDTKIKHDEKWKSSLSQYEKEKSLQLAREMVDFFGYN